MKHQKPGFLAAGLATSCCVMPLLLVTLGLGGSVLTVVLVQYKAYLMTLALAALAYAWWHYVRDTRECTAAACALVGGRLRRWLLGVNTGVVMLFLGITYTPAGALVSALLQGGTAPAPTTRALGPVSAASAGRPVAVAPAPPRGEGSAQTRLEQLALRVEGMS